MARTTQVQGILLAAGLGRRWRAAGGSTPKLLHPLADGTPMVLAAARALSAALPDSLAVVRRSDTDIAQALMDLGMDIIWADERSEGMGENLAKAVRSSQGTPGWVVALGDMPCIQTTTICQVADALRQGHDLVAPFFQNLRGHPVGFSRTCGAQLMALRGDRGAAELLQRQAQQIHRLNVDDPGVLMDFDTPQAASTLG